jgi:hypothetical protein
VRAIGLTAIVLRERDGSNVTVPVASDAALTGVRKGRAWRGTLLGLRRGMTVATVQDGEEPAERVHVLRPPALPLPPALLTTLFGDRMARADLVVQVGTAPTLYRLDRGRIRAIGATFIVLRERDGTNQTVAVGDDAVVTGIGRGRLKRGVLAALKRSMVVETVRQGDQPAERIHVVGR